MPSKNNNNTTTQYAASTFSEATSTYSYDKDALNSKPIKEKRSLKQKVKSVLKDIGTNPFEYDDDSHKQPATWVAKLPPSRT